MPGCKSPPFSRSVKALRFGRRHGSDPLLGSAPRSQKPQSHDCQPLRSALAVNGATGQREPDAVRGGHGGQERYPRAGKPRRVRTPLAERVAIDRLAKLCPVQDAAIVGSRRAPARLRASQAETGDEWIGETNFVHLAPGNGPGCPASDRSAQPGPCPAAPSPERQCRSAAEASKTTRKGPSSPPDALRCVPAMGSFQPRESLALVPRTRYRVTEEPRTFKVSRKSSLSRINNNTVSQPSSYQSGPRRQMENRAGQRPQVIPPVAEPVAR